MSDKVYTLSEAAKAVGLSEETLSQLLKENIVKPSVIADGKDILFDEGDLAHIEQAARLNRMGYGVAEIRKIVRKVGLPEQPQARRRVGKPDRYLTVGELETRTRISSRTIKYWEERGIIEPTKRSEGGFRLYHESYVLLFNLIKDLQLFGYSLEEIKEIGDMFRLFFNISKGLPIELNSAEITARLDEMLAKIESLNLKMKEFQEGIERWKTLLKSKRTEIIALKKTQEQKALRRESSVSAEPAPQKN